MSIDRRINSLDLSLYDKIHSQTWDCEKESLLNIQSTIREYEYCYLEIGSFMGGSLQPHLLDPMCKLIYSIDSRKSQSNQKNNDLEFMMCGLKKVQNDLRKIITFECDARDISTNQINEKADFAFIDGWHSDEGVFSDFISCLDLCKENACIAFHDTFWVSNGILKIYDYLSLNRIKFKKYLLNGSISLIVLGENRIFQNKSSFIVSTKRQYFFNAFLMWKILSNKFPFLKNLFFIPKKLIKFLLS